jgi:D-alanyl-lipoteichoic acid acyltransferase DltB (MBOAT superfamily)
VLFNSFEFLIFLACMVAGYQLALRVSDSASRWVLLAGSLVFYAWWEPVLVLLLTASVLVNFALGEWLRRRAEAARPRKALLALGIAFDLGLIAWFKYAAFIAGTIGNLTDRSLDIGDIVLPLGISFFTFQQITWLTDAAAGKTRRARLRDYALFVTFFPQLIAGPIVHHNEMMPQFANARQRRVLENLSIGAAMFVIGLFKKVVIADSIAPFADGAFDMAAAGTVPSLLDAWTGAFAYSFQIYFDFSAYSDMALGLARMFGIRLPINFFSPYKSQSIIEFWRRWHISLSRFLRDYVYIPLGGSRRGAGTQFGNILITMTVGGLWHGAGWTFVVWGTLHGALIVGNHLLRRLFGQPDGTRSAAMKAVCVAFMFVLITITWVPFRAADFAATQAMFAGMAGLGGVHLPTMLAGLPGIDALVAAGLAQWRPDMAVMTKTAPLWLAVGLLIAWGLPNTVQITARYRPVLDPTRVTRGAMGRRILAWRPTPAWGVGLGAMGAAAVLLFRDVSPFLYFQF